LSVAKVVEQLNKFLERIEAKRTELDVYRNLRRKQELKEG
jgi:hypothetical protein